MSTKTDTVTPAQIERATKLVANGRFSNVEEVFDAGLDYVEAEAKKPGLPDRPGRPGVPWLKARDGVRCV